MCEYCGCQDIDVIGELTAEHDELRSLSRDLAEAANSRDSRRARQLASDMLAILGPHTRVEERGLFPELAADFADPLAELEREHHVIEAALTDLAEGRPSDTWPQRTIEAAALLFDHILKEQDGVFPAALGILSADAWERVADVRTKDVSLRSA